MNGACLSGISQHGELPQAVSRPSQQRASGDRGLKMVSYPQVRRTPAQGPWSPLSEPAPHTRGRANFARFRVYVHNMSVPAGEDVSIDLPARGRGVSEEAS